MTSKDDRKHPAYFVGAGYDRVPGDFYETPPEAVEALLAEAEMWFPNLDSWLYWEPASGNGAISRVLEAHGYNVISSDIRTDEDVYGERGVNFLTEDRKVNCIITNPPFSLAEAFIRHAWDCASRTAMLLRLSFLEGQKRRALFREIPLQRVLVFSRRVKIKGPKGDRGNMMAMAWFIWEHGWGWEGDPVISWIPSLKKDVLQ